MLLYSIVLIISIVQSNGFHASYKFLHFEDYYIYSNSKIVLRSKLSNDKNNDFKTNYNQLTSTNYESMQSIKKMIKLPISLLLGYTLYPPAVCRSEKGAFEMDAEFYIKNLFGMNENVKEKVFKNQPIYKSPRIMDTSFTKNILDIIIHSIVVINNDINHDNLSRDKLIQLVSERIPITLQYFKTFAPITKEDITDQYYFDMILYLYYIQAGILINASENRVLLRSLIGNEILQMMLLKYNLNNIIKTENDKILPIYQKDNINKASNGLSTLSSGIIKVLDIFKSNGIIANYEFDVDDMIDIPYAQASFKDNLPVTFQITLKEPSTIISFLEGAGANTLFHPEIIGTTIVSLATQLGYTIRYDDYLMDNYYRTENRDIQAQDILLQFGLYYI